MLANIFQLLLNTVNSFTSDYGLTIIIITIMINIMLLPLVIKQKKSMKDIQELNNKVNEIKDKYKNNEKKMNEELQNLYQSNPKSLLGFALLFIQAPIFVVLHKLFTKNIVNTTTKIMPWISSLSLPDPYFILPIIYVLIQLMPSLLCYLNLIKGKNIPKLSAQTLVFPVIMALLFVAKMPSALGIYFVTSSLIQSIQQISL